MPPTAAKTWAQAYFEASASSPAASRTDATNNGERDVGTVAADTQTDTSRMSQQMCMNTVAAIGKAEERVRGQPLPCPALL